MSRPRSHDFLIRIYDSFWKFILIATAVFVLGTAAQAEPMILMVQVSAYDELNVRDVPDSEATRLGGLGPTQCVVATETTGGEGGDWRYITHPIKGWVHGYYLSRSDACSTAFDMLMEIYETAAESCLENYNNSKLSDSFPPMAPLDRAGILSWMKNHVADSVALERYRLDLNYDNPAASKSEKIGEASLDAAEAADKIAGDFAASVVCRNYFTIPESPKDAFLSYTYFYANTQGGGIEIDVNSENQTSMNLFFQSVDGAWKVHKVMYTDW